MNASIPSVPKYSYILPFEENFDRETVEQWASQNFNNCLFYSGAYLLAVFLGQIYMKNKQPYNLRLALATWNFILAIVSLGGALRSVPELAHVLHHFGFQYSICNPSYIYDSPVTAFWVYIFVVSKLFEFLDTLFIILRKQKLIFLHWFHHSSVSAFVSIVYRDGSAMGRWFMSMNFTVHAAMYTYFTLRALRIRIPASVAAGVTTIQVLQMLMGFFISVQAFAKWYTQVPECAITFRCAITAITLYSFYLCLFVDFFVKSYLKPVSRKSD